MFSAVGWAFIQYTGRPCSALLAATALAAGSSSPSIRMAVWSQRASIQLPTSCLITPKSTTRPRSSSSGAEQVMSAV